MAQTAAAPGPWLEFAWRVVACHMTSYFVIGWLASSVLGYRELFGSGDSPAPGAWQYMRAFDSPWVAAGPMLQVVRGLLFAGVLWPLRSLWVDEQTGAWRVWALVVGLAMVGATAAAPGSLEGIIYTRLSVSDHLLGWPEMGTQTLLFCVFVQRWYRHPSRWWNPLMIAAVGVVCCLSMLGVLAASHPGAFGS
jgi:hypothetical protein